MSFIKKVFIRDLKDADNSVRAWKRDKHIAWPSESSVTLDGITLGVCKRSLYYKYMGYKPTEKPSIVLRSVGDTGNLYEDYIIEKYRKNGFIVRRQTPVSIKVNALNEFMVSGRLDVVLDSEDERLVIEVKSISAFKAMALSSKHIELPEPMHVMQVLQYKYFLDTTEDKDLSCRAMYLCYINRSSSSLTYYRVDVDPQGYPIITPISQNGVIGEPINTAQYPTFAEILDGSNNAIDTRIAQLRFNTKDIFSSFSTVFGYMDSKTLPAKDYPIIMTTDIAERDYKLGLISKQRLTKIKKGETICHKQCSYCPYLKQCLSDSGITLKEQTGDDDD